jgi:adenylate cyclase
MRFIPNIRYGTERYPEKVARRLRATNIGAWIGSCTLTFFAVWRFLDGSAHWKYAALVALAYGLAPILHRFGPQVAVLALAAIAYAWIFYRASEEGTASGITFFYWVFVKSCG